MRVRVHYYTAGSGGNGLSIHCMYIDMWALILCMNTDTFVFL